MASVNGENEEMAHIGKVKAGGTGQKKLDINMGHNKPVRNECLSIVHGIVENGIDTACSSGENIHVNGRNDVSDQTIFNESATLKSTTENHESTVKTLLHGLVDTIVKIHSSQFVVKSFDMPKESVSHHSNGKLLDVKLCTSQNVKEKGNNVKNTFASSKEQVNMIDNGEAYVLPVKKENPLQGKVLDSLSADALALLDECQKSEKILLTLDKSVKSIDTHDEIISISTNKSYKMEDDKSFSQNNNKTFEENLLSTGTKSRPFVSTSEDISTTKSLDPLRSSRRKRIPKKKIDEEKPEVPITPIIKEKLPIVETEIIYILGDLVWAYVPGHPLWPCMIVDDPLEPVFTKMKGGGAKPGRAYHVQFLGDSPEHGWVRETRVFSYTGPEDYERIIKEIALKHKRLNIKVPRLEIPARLKDDWDSGLEEIMEAVVCSVEERMINFAYDFKPYMKKLKNKRVVYSAGVTANAEDEEKPSSKEKPEDFNSSIKQSNPKQKSSAVTKKAIKIKMKSPAGINSKSSRSGRMKKQEAITSLMLGKETSPNQELFKFYCEKRLGPLKTEHPTLTPEQVEALIWMEWESLSPEKQEKYGAKRSLSSPEVLKRKRGRPFKRPPVKNQDVAMNSAMLPETKAVEVKNLFRCTLCNDSYATKHSLAQHKRWCSGPPSAAKATFSEKSSLSSNPIENTSLEKTFTCHDCQDKFYGEKSLQIHKKFCSASKSSSPLTAVLSPRRKVVGDRSKRRSAKTFDDAPSDKSSSLPVRTSTPTNSSQPSPTAVANKNLLCHDNSAPCSNNNAIMGYSINDGSLITKKSKPRGPTQLGSSSRKENICVICEEAKPGLISCVGGCCQSFHAACFGDEENTKEIVDGLFKCKNCINHTHCCFICKKGAGTSSADLGDIKRCNVPHCGKHYHSLCLHSRKLSILAAAEDSGHNMAESFRYSLLNNSRCTFHHCATCASKATDDLSSTGAGCRMFKCLRCPTAYHAGIDCLAAGSTILPGLNIICPEHFEPLKNTPYHQPVHVSWCFVCSKGGQLICCENCPAAFHPQCVDMDAPPEGEWYCRDCRYRRRPLYGDIVWVKLGSYRWWPGEITHPNDVPENIQNLRHGVGEFVVNFFGSNDYFWLNKRRVFAYQEGDTGASTAHCSRGISSVFNKALRDASKKFDELTSRRQKIQDVKTQKKRPQYKYIKVNRPVGNVQVYTCDLSEIPRCICKRTDSNPCGPDSECLNRMLMFECHPTLCPAGDKCENRRFQKRDYPSSEVFKTSWGGWGLKTKVSIKKGDFVNEYVGELVDNEECLRRIEYAHKNNITNFYMLTIDKDRIIDAGPKGNLSRFMNHCCDPSCETQKWTVNGDTRVGLFARRDIPEGTELTFNYNLDCLGNDKTPCMCGAKNCSGFIGVRPKPSTENGKSIETKVKKKRKRAEQRDLPKHDDFCFRCRQVGTLVCCDVRGCQRAFCLACLRLTKPPFGKWECPWHHCDFCGRRAQSFCHFCPNSFCASHVANQLLPSAPNKYDCCTDHDPNVAEYEMEEAIAAVVASMQPQENYEPGLDVKEPEEVTPLTPQDVKEKETPKATSKKIAQKEIPKTAEKQTLKASRKQNTKTTLKQATKNSRKQNLKLNLKNNLKKRVTSARKPTSKISLKKDPKASLKRPLKIVRKPIPIKRGRTTEEKEDNPKSRVRSLKRKRVEQKKNSVMEVKTEPVVVKDEVVAAPPPDFMNDTVTETESDTELLGVPRSSPVRRKRAKRRYFSGKKKRRKSKGIASLSASPNKLLLTDSASNNGSQLNSCTDDDQEVDVTSVSTLAT